LFASVKQRAEGNKNSAPAKSFAHFIGYTDSPICAPKPATGQKKNVLFLAVDDLCPELGTYGIDFVNLWTLTSWPLSRWSLREHTVKLRFAHHQELLCSLEGDPTLTMCGK